MFDLNFVAEPGMQAESTEASWSFLQKSTEPEIMGVPKSTFMETKKSVANWKYYGIVAFAVIILAVISMFVNSQPKVNQDIVLNQVINLIIESDYMKDLKLREAHFKPDFVKVTLTASELGFLQNFTQTYQKENTIPYEIFQKNELNYLTLNFPWKGEKNEGNIETLKTLTDNTVFSNKIVISFTDDEFELQGWSSDIISYLLQMADNGLIQKFTFLVLQLESGKFSLKVQTNKI